MGINDGVIADDDAENKIREITSGSMPTLVIDATGNSRAIESGVNFMAHGGRYILVGLSNKDISFHHPSIHAKETSLLCSRNATYEDFQNVKELLESGVFPTENFITHRTSPTNLIKELPKWSKPKSGVIKAMMHF